MATPDLAFVSRIINVLAKLEDPLFLFFFKVIFKIYVTSGCLLKFVVLSRQGSQNEQ